MQFRLLIPASFATFLPLLCPTLASPISDPFEHSHWYETRSVPLPPTQNQSSIPSLVIDTFQDPLHNDLGFWHGAGENLTTVHQPGLMRLFPIDPDQNFHTQFDTHGCFSLAPWQNQYMHVVFEGTDQFTVSLNEHNSECNPRRSPFPGVPDSVQASRYVMRTRLGISREDGADNEAQKGAQAVRLQKSQPQRNSCKDEKQGSATSVKTELFIPLSHFRIRHDRVMSVSFSGFYTKEPLTLQRVELVPTVPSPSIENEYFRVPDKLPTGTVVLRCTRPNSFAFGIDDGQPQYAQEVMRILDEENVRATFFVVGAGLRDSSTNFTSFYLEMLRKGHQVAFHSNKHPK